MTSPVMKRRRIGGPLPAMLLLGALALLAAIYVRLWTGLLELPALGGIDFVSFYTAGRIASSGAYGQLYNLDLQHTIQAPIVGPNFVPGGTLPFNHPPILAPLLGMIAFDDYRASYIAWSVVLLCMHLLVGIVAARLLAEHGLAKQHGGIAAAGTVLFYPAFVSLLKGQDTAFTLLGALVWMWALLGRRERLAGIALTLVLLKPQIALALALPLMASRNRAAWWFCGASALVALYSFVLVGWSGLLDLLSLLRLSSEGLGYGMNQAAMYNLLGLMIRTVPGIDPAILNVVKWAVFVLAIGGLCWFWWGKGSSLSLEHIGLGVILCLFASPHLHLHDLSLLLLPALSLAVWLWQRGRRGQTAALAILPVSSLLLFASDLFKHPLHYAAGYVLMLALGVGLGATMWAAGRMSYQTVQEA